MTGNISRRTALGGLAMGATAGSLAPGAALGEANPPAASASSGGVCILWPQAVEGPYYFDPKLVRSDITGGRPGTPVKLSLKFIELGSCRPLSNVRVDVWHADAGGVYSGYGSQGDKRTISTKGETYLRGTQMTDAGGGVNFTTIYPGWYPGRTPHIHVKAFLDETALVTGQMYFPDDVSTRVYREQAPYTSREAPDTTNATDGIYRDGQKDGGGTVLVVGQDAGLITAALVIAVDRSGKAAAAKQGWGGFVRGLLGK